MSNPTMERLYYPSADGKSRIAAYVWLPAGEPRGVVQLSHGMCEHVQRYAAVAAYFCAAGFVFCGNDHIGHGESVSTPEDLGYLPRAAAHMVEDLHTMTDLMKARFAGLPIILYGHSMGSFAARQYAATYGDEIDGLIVSGTAGAGQPTLLGRAVAGLISLIKGDRHRSRLLLAIAFGSYNKRFKCEKDTKSWLTRDKALRNAYRDDPLCGFPFTAAGYGTLFTLLGKVSRWDWAGKLPKTLPVLLISGSDDPVGGYGKGVHQVLRRLRNAGVEKVQMVLFEGGRHEMHNEIDRDEALARVLAFIKEQGA